MSEEYSGPVPRTKAVELCTAGLFSFAWFVLCPCKSLTPCNSVHAIAAIRAIVLNFTKFEHDLLDTSLVLAYASFPRYARALIEFSRASSKYADLVFPFCN